MFRKAISSFLAFTVILSCLFSLPISTYAEERTDVINEESSNPKTTDCDNSIKNDVDTSYDVTNDDYDISLASTGVSEDMYSKEYSKYVPYFVEKSDNVFQPLYNPDSVYMLWDFCMSTYGIGKDDSWAEAPQKYGYSQYYRVENNGIDGVGQDFTSSDNAIVGIKKVSFDGQEKYAIVVAFRGSGDIGDWLNNFSVLYTSDGIHSGFEVAANQFYENTKNMTFVIGQDTISLYDIIQDMKNEDSKYCMLVTGHSLGGAIADVYVGYKLYNDGISPKNVMTYTFAAPKSAVRSYKYPYRNIINIINEDDCVPTVGGDKQIGKNMIYSPDDDFRVVAYMNTYNYESGHSSKWWNNIVNFLNTDHVAHDLEPTYKKIILEFKEHTEKYTKYHTNEAPEEEHSAVEVRFIPNYRNSSGKAVYWNNIFMVWSGGEIVSKDCGSWPGTELTYGGKISNAGSSAESTFYDCEIPGGSHVVFSNGIEKNRSVYDTRPEVETKDFVVPDNCDWVNIYLSTNDIGAGWYEFSQGVEFDAWDGEFLYRSMNKTQVQILGHYHEKENITIPNRCGNYSVIKLYDKLFYKDNHIKSVEIPNSIIFIGSSAFEGCSNLESVSFDEGPAYIYSAAFYDCINLKSVNINNVSEWCLINFDTQKSNPLYYAHNLNLNGETLTELSIPDNVELIKKYAFINCTSIKRIDFSQVKEIQEYAFEGCENLVSVSNTEGITSFGNYSFENCKSLQSFILPSTISTLSSGLFSGCENLSNIKIPDNVTDIGAAAFYDCTSLIGITIPTAVTVIRSGTFENCTNLQSVQIPNGVTRIDSYAFANCSVLNEIFIPGNVTSIGDSAFKKCSKLKTITLPNEITYIPMNCFAECMELLYINIQGNIDSIGAKAFYGCKKLNHVFYFGSEEQWNSKTLYLPNSELQYNCTIHFETQGEVTFEKNIAPNCTEDGYDIFNCTVCGECRGNKVDRLGHNYSDIVVEASCKNAGYTLHKCSRCNDEYKDNYTKKLPHHFVNGKCTECGLYEDECAESIHPYEDDCDQKWSITKNGAKRIAITFAQETETESDYDYIYIYDYDNSEIGRYSGKELSGKRIIIYGDSVTIRLVSDDSNNYYGFSLTKVEVYYDECNHLNRELINYRKATCGDKGYSGDYRCTECHKILEEGESIPATGDHHFVDGFCTECSMKDPHTYPEISLGKAARIDMSDDEQSNVYKFVPTNDMLVRFYSTGDADSIGYINDSNMNELVFDDDSGEDMNFEIVYLLKANELYLFEINRYGDEDTFDISLVEIPVEIIKVGDDKKVSGNSYFKFTPNTDMFIDFYSTDNENSDYDCYLYDSNFTILDTASYYDFPNFKLNYSVNANQVYYIACINSFDTSENYEFDVTLREIQLSPTAVGDTLTFNDHENYHIISATDDMYISCYLKYDSKNLSCVYDASTMKKVGAEVNDNELVFLAEKGKKYIMYVSVDDAHLGKQTVSLTEYVIPEIKLGETKKITTSTFWAWHMFRFVPQNDITVRFSSSGDERFNVNVLNPNLEYMYVETNYIEDEEGETKDIQYVLEAGTEYVFAVPSESDVGEYNFSITLESIENVLAESILGDVDGDGEVTIIDATCIQRHLASIPTFAYIEAVADTDGDGEVTIIDATYIQRWLANLKSNDKIGKLIK